LFKQTKSVCDGKRKLKKFEKQIRFPRLKESSASKLNAKILWRTYNKMAMSKSPKLRHYGNFDIYRTKKGWLAEKSIKLLAVILIERKIDPDTYIKVMCKYGNFESSPFMPPASWLVKEETISMFETWFLKRKRNEYVHKEDWKQAIDAWNIKDVYKEIETIDKGSRDLLESIFMEYPPWLIIAYLFNEPKIRTRFRGKLFFYTSRSNKEFRRLIKERYKKHF